MAQINIDIQISISKNSALNQALYFSNVGVMTFINVRKYIVLALRVSAISIVHQSCSFYARTRIRLQANSFVDTDFGSLHVRGNQLSSLFHYRNTTDSILKIWNSRYFVCIRELIQSAIDKLRRMQSLCE